jgi:hypothetical protein
VPPISTAVPMPVRCLLYEVHNDVLKFTELQKTFLDITANIESLLLDGLTDENFFAMVGGKLSRYKLYFFLLFLNQIQNFALKREAEKRDYC